MTYEEKYLITEEAIKNRHKLKAAKTAPFIFFINQVFVISLLITALLIGTENYALFLLIPAILAFTFLFIKKSKMSAALSSCSIILCMPVFLVSAHETCIRNQNKPLDSSVWQLVEEISDDQAILENAKKNRDNRFKEERNTADRIYIITALEDIFITLLVIKFLKDHDELKQLDGYPLFEVNFDKEIDEKINNVTEERIMRKEKEQYEYLQ